MHSSLAPLEPTRRTTADTVFDELRDDIIKMRLRPGTRLSEAEVAKRHDISRQPVREAFIRLDNLRLLHIRPQRATVVRPMSREAIRRSRFIRLAVEVEVTRRACEQSTAAKGERLELMLQRQRERLDAEDLPGFHNLDHVFHAEICAIAGCEDAIDVIVDCKATVDRLCMLALRDAASGNEIYDDHSALAKHIQSGDCDAASAVTRRHLSRLDQTIEAVQAEHPDYFED